MKREGYVIGIDPDVEKSGVALLDCAAREFKRVEAMKFPDVVDRFAELAAMKADGKDVVVVIEDSYLSANWHVNPRDNKATAYICATPPAGT